MGLPCYSQNSDPELFLSKRTAGKKMEKRLRERRSSDWPKLGSSSREAPRTDRITDAQKADEGQKLGTPGVE